MENSINTLFLEAAKAIDGLSNRLGGEVATQRVFNGNFLARDVQKAYQNFNIAMNDMGIDLQRAERVLQALDTKINGTGAATGMESFFDPNGGQIDANSNSESQADFLMDLNLNEFGDGGVNIDDKKNNGFVDLDGIDMGSNLDELDLNLLDIPNDDGNNVNTNAANDDPVDMDKLYDLIGLN